MRGPWKVVALLLTVASAACAQRVRANRSEEKYIQVGDRQRSYIVDVPPGYDPRRPAPLVFVFHGGGGNASFAKTQSGMTELAKTAGFIAVYPNGTGRFKNLLLTWNTTSCCGYAQKENVDEVAFIRALIDTLEATLAVDRRRIYATGLSNGGMMSHLMGCALSDRFAAIAPVSGELSMAECRPTQPVSVLMIHGTADEHLPYNGGVGAKAADPHEVKSVAYALDKWRTLDRCTGASHADSTTALIHTSFLSCANGTTVQLYTIIGGGHSWPGSERVRRAQDAPSDALDASRVIWDFFAAHPKGTS